MNNQVLIKFIISIARVSRFGTRGIIRKFFISVLRKLTNETGNIKLNINQVPFIIYFDTDFKAIFENYDLREINFLIHNLEKDGAFIDIGANYGYYSQTLSYHNLVNKIISIEPNKKFLPRIQNNFSLLLDHKKKISPIIVENLAVSDTNEYTYLNLELGLGSAYLQKEESLKSIKISSDTLVNILSKNNIKKISGIKIDVEGHEDKALIPFFNGASKELYPKIILIEYTSKINWSLDVIAYLKELGYEEQFRTKANMALKLETKLC
ncbi:FkbM family methyltransferase [Pelagibacteraceae bacterium]|nr:FkbM family methyltransferase [Pelagibacteraceae bacterium]